MKNLTRIFILVLCLLQYTINVQAENQVAIDPTLFYRVAVEINNADDMDMLVESGVDLVCGAQSDVRNGKDVMILEVSGSRLEEIQSRNLSVEILIQDLTTYLTERAKEWLPIEIEMLEAEKAEANYIARFGQEQGCQEIDFIAPSNFHLDKTYIGILRYDDILEELDSMFMLFPNLITSKASAHPTLLTHQGNQIHYVKISDNPTVNEVNEPDVLYTALHHGNEPMSMMNQIYYMWYLLENYGSDPDITALVDRTEMYFIPVVNPDGYRRNETNPATANGGGMHRKNGHDWNGDGVLNYALEGVDINRNYDYKWASVPGGSSSDPDHDRFQGAAAFSEPESQIIKYFTENHDFITAFNCHSNGNTIVRPFGDETQTNPDETLYEEMCEHMCWHNSYYYGTTPEIYYATDGEAGDWMYDTEDVMSFTPEVSIEKWPDTSSIVIDCKKMMRPNLMLAYSASNYGILNDLSSYSLNSLNPSLDFSVQHLSPVDGAFTITISSSNPMVSSIDLPVLNTNTLSNIEYEYLSTTIQLDCGITSGTVLEFDITLNNGTHDIYSTTIQKVYKSQLLYSEDGNSVSQWQTTGSWNSTDSEAYTGSSSFTDSPNGTMSTASSTLTSGTLNLSGYANPKLDYYTKWDIYKFIDYVQLEISVNGGNWIPVCSRNIKSAHAYNWLWSHPNFGDNPAGNQRNADVEKVYDGLQQSWVREEIDLTSFLPLTGPRSIQIRFVAEAADATFAKDGIYIDDISIYCDPAPSAAVIHRESFENGWGLFNSSSNDAVRTSFFATDGSYSARLRDNSGALSAIETDPLDLSAENKVVVSFDYHPKGFENNENFFLEVARNGTGYTAVGTWSKDVHFENDITQSASVKINGPFSSNAKIRLRSDASDNTDRVLIDNILISSALCDDNDPCTINDVLDETCTCAGVDYDFDGDGECLADDPNDYNACVPTACTDCPQQYYTDFQNGWDIWIDGGSQCDIVNVAGTMALNLIGNSSSSVATTQALNLSGMGLATVDFIYATHSFEANEDFFLEYSADGTNFVVVKQFIQGVHFVNGEIITEHIEISDGDFNLNDNSVLRFRASASDNQDFLYIDNISINACNISWPKLAEKEETPFTSNVYPNPAQIGQSFFIETNNSEGKMAIELINNRGQQLMIQHSDLDNSSTEISTDGLSPGTYYIRVYHSKGVDLKKVLILGR